jgi:Ras-related protein Rab-18
MGSPGAGSSGGHECPFKILFIGDSAVGKSSLLVSFVAAAPLDEDIAPTIGTSHASSLLRSGLGGVFCCCCSERDIRAWWYLSI